MEVLKLSNEAFQHVLHGHLPPHDLTALLISKLLGVSILAGACITKLPQLLNIVRARSAAGVSAVSLELELYVGLVHVAYGHFFKLPITAFGEAAVIWLQNVVILGCVYKFGGARAVRPLLTTAWVAAAIYVLSSGALKAEHMAKLYDMNSSIYIISRLPQILQCFREGKTGQLSLITSTLMFVGALARIFTSIKEGAGAAMVRGFMIGTAVNGILLAQILFYGPDGRAKKKKAE